MKIIYKYSIITFMAIAITTTASAGFKQIKQKITDTLITTVIKGKITKDKDLNPLNISVSTLNSEVILSGYVKNKQSFVKTLRTATSTKGVKSIDASDLEIKKVNSAFTDAYITAKIEAAVLEAKVIDDESIPLVGINASTENGVATVTGSVSSTKSIAAILKRVNRLQGIKKVISNLEVTEDATS
ncbi:MAG: BON domain-containing protein [Legionellaceae bacterium]|nr:BON domain-containing protein [Legionellaceae bacterium]